MNNYIEPLKNSQNLLLHVSLLCLIFLIIDLIWLGTGAIWRKTVGFSMRYIWFCGVIVFSLPLLLANIKLILAQKVFICIWLLGGYLLFSCLVGVIQGNNPIVLRQDLSGFANFMILPSLIYLLSNIHNVLCIMKVIIINCLGISLATCVLSCYRLLPYQELIYKILDENQIVSLSPMGGQITRVFFHGGTRYLFIGILFASFFYFMEHRRSVKYAWLCCFAFMWLAVLLSFTRGIYLGCLIGMLIVIYHIYTKCHCYWKQLQSLLINGLCAFVLILMICTFIIDENPILPAFERSISVFNAEQIADMSYLHVESEVNGLDIRRTKVTLLKESIYKNPILGNGLGATIPYSDEFVEYFYYDMVNKMGIIGMLIYLLPLICVFAIKKPKYSLVGDIHYTYMHVVFLVGLVYFLIITATNPCMNTTTGILYYCMAMSAIICIKHNILYSIWKQKMFSLRSLNID